jgi:hypothetical protein
VRGTRADLDYDRLAHLRILCRLNCGDLEGAFDGFANNGADGLPGPNGQDAQVFIERDRERDGYAVAALPFDEWRASWPLTPFSSDWDVTNSPFGSGVDAHDSRNFRNWSGMS